jgi:hypothetical protein
LLQFEDVLLKEGKRYLVLPADSMLAIEILYHSPHPERYRLLNDPGSLTPFDFNIKRLAPFFDVPIHLLEFERSE